MFDKMKQLMEMKRQADMIKKELDAAFIESTEVRGIKIVMSGSQNIKSIELDSTLFNSNNKMQLEKDLLRSFNAAILKSQRLGAEKMKAVMPGF